jgi:hypothetical protein
MVHKGVVVMKRWREWRRAIYGTLAAAGIWWGAMIAIQPPVTPQPLPVAPHGARRVILTNDYSTAVTVAGRAYLISVPAGFISDLASVPKQLEPRLGLSWDAPCLRRGALIHDRLYDQIKRADPAALPKDLCDLILWQAILDDGCVPAKAEAVYEAVRLWGFTALRR